MLPENVKAKAGLHTPVDENDEMYLESIQSLKESGYTDDEIEYLKHFFNKKGCENILHELNVHKNVAFFEYYSNDHNPPDYSIAEDLFGLDQIYEQTHKYNWLNFRLAQYDDEETVEYRNNIIKTCPNAADRYLQLTSIEGGGSYFYDVETDYVYDVDWGKELDMVTGKLKPWFTSSYDFLEWYYSGTEEDQENGVDWH